ncbi:ribonuclease domain-containing protein [Haloechinothrix salitolerans]|uniref:Ribonuclease domain-containing protein n=1 Tax=Haloechinothrix salitolerans TaxID=926830 RepID=A0ABW2BZW7_9PSEU
MFSRRRISAALVGLLVLVVGGWLVQDVVADGNAGSDVVALSELPPQATETWQRIQAGGPFPYPSDGTVFGNREGLLPDRPHGYYQEYTVDTPGLDHRGARRLVTGEDGELYYTEDHYQSFVLVDPDR